MASINLLNQFATNDEHLIHICDRITAEGVWTKPHLFHSGSKNFSREYDEKFRNYCARLQQRVTSIRIHIVTTEEKIKSMDDSARLLVELDARINSSDRLSESECKSDVDDGNKFKSSIVTEEHQLIRHEIFPHDFNDFDQYCKFNSIDDISNNSLALDERLLEWCDGIDVGEIFDFIDDMDITELENITMDVELKSNDNFMLVGSFGDEAFANFDVHIEQHLHDEREGCSVSPFTRSQIEENHFDGSKSSRECIGQTGLLWSDVTSELNSCNGSSDICHDMEDEECAYVQEFTEVASKSTSVMNTRMRKKVRSRGINEVKREQNRTAACRYRKRKLELKQDMRKEIHILELRNIELETQISSFQKEIDFLKNIFTLHASSAELNFRRVL